LPSKKKVYLCHKCEKRSFNINVMKRATNARTQKAKEKIENAINILRMENRPITIYSVSKESGVSYNTASKYSKLINGA
jgi:uncharacterized membrane protein